jgi:hypothetical protein
MSDPAITENTTLEIKHDEEEVLKETSIDVITTVEEVKYEGLMERINILMEDQDFKQKMNVVITLVLEIYRVLMGAFLILFVPQNCNDNICSQSDNYNRNDTLSKTGFSLNCITMFSFLFLYYIEVKRENKLITYLEVNRFEPRDNESVEQALLKLEDSKKESIWKYDGYYQKMGFVSLGMFLLNTTVSSIVVYTHYLDNSTVTVYLTNVLFLGFKVSDVFSTVNTKKNIFFSAYLKRKVQFNDVDPDKKIKDYVEA